MKYKIIEITTPTCSVCKMLKPMIEMIVTKHFNQIELDVRDYEDEFVKELIEKHVIRSVPVFFFMKDDEVIDTHFGAITAPALKTFCEKLIS